MKRNKKSSASTTAKLWNITWFQKKKKKNEQQELIRKLTQKYNNKKYILLLTLFRSSRPWAVLSSCRQQCRGCRNQTHQIEKTDKHEQTDKNEQIKWVNWQKVSKQTRWANVQKWANKQNEQMDKTSRSIPFFLLFFLITQDIFVLFLFFVCFFVSDHWIHQISGISLVKARPPWLQISNLFKTTVCQVHPLSFHVNTHITKEPPPF